MKKKALLFGVHMHQPVDNFGDAVDEAIRLCYAPFFETMREFPDFKFAVHASGWLLNEIRTKHEAIFENMRYLTKAGAIEWVGAGYYEPILSSIPSRDRRAQLLKLSEFLHTHLGVKPSGSWLTERVWDASLVPDLTACEYKYVVVDDYHFASSGFDAKKLDGYYHTEEGGEVLGLFPISGALRYALPFFSVERALETIQEASLRDGGAAVIFDDAEKFGLWPKTHDWVYEKGWLRGFVQAVLDAPDICSMHFHEYFANEPSLGIAYLGNTSYFEMGEWSLAPKQTLALEQLKSSVGESYFANTGIALIKGGIWKNFLVKYPESNYIHKRMLGHSKSQEQLTSHALEALYKLQTNDVFWHGVFGGLYLPNLRDNAYNYLLSIEKSLATPHIQEFFVDVDMDGVAEQKVLTPKLSIVISPRHGAQMMEFGSLEVCFNWQNTLMRRYEAYHEKILHPTAHSHAEVCDGIETIHALANTIDPALLEALVYDWHSKYSFVDHFLQTAPTLHALKRMEFTDIGDFAKEPFVYDAKEELYVRHGGLFLERMHEANLYKKYRFFQSGINLGVEFEQEGEASIFYTLESNFHFAHPKNVSINGQLVGDGLELDGASDICIFDDFTQKNLHFRLSRACKLFVYPAQTVSQSEGGFELLTQHLTFTMLFEIQQRFVLELFLEVSDV